MMTDAERKVGNRFRIDVGLEVDIRTAAETDRIGETVDYRLIHGIVLEWIEKRRFRLLETMAQSLAEELTLANPGPFRLKVLGVTPNKLDMKLVETGS